jgi:glutamyl-tRNA synthetase
MVRTRMAPSPTGENLHIGSLATTLVNYAYAKKRNGQFIVRTEDTDRKRFVPGAEKKILETFRLFGLEPDEDSIKGGPYAPYRQSERLRFYIHYAKKLIEKNKAYYCFCSPERLEKIREKAKQQKKQPKYDRYCLSLSKSEILENMRQNLPYVIRLKIPEGETSFIDKVRGKITVQNYILDDQILIKSDGFPTYHLAVVVDDHLMKITHILRGEEWISSTPKHVIIYEGLGWKLPTFAHLPLLRNPDKSKLSKRKNPVWSSWYLEQGYLPEAVLNYLALMGWSHPKEKEIFNLTEYINVLDLNDIDPTGPIFDMKKLEWINGEYIRMLTSTELKTKIINYYSKYQNRELPKKIVEQTIPLVQTRMKKLSDYWSLTSFIYNQPLNIEVKLNFLVQAKERLFKIYKQTDWQHEKIYKATETVAKEINIKPIKLYMDIRFALSNQRITAPLFEGMEIIGKEETICRLKKILE